jgi:hypothetical protein
MSAGKKGKHRKYVVMADSQSMQGNGNHAFADVPSSAFPALRQRRFGSDMDFRSADDRSCEHE